LVPGAGEKPRSPRAIAESKPGAAGLLVAQAAARAAAAEAQ
jgi:hypothetical protein